ncbi:phosphoribosyltransferase [Mesorhizobium sp. CAU 1741]|uniref:phosphoribosyltransferase n=1 Tax=Mesorhizobium sp. CAU 1741 TaxID=3140366 RepID=UPI00325AC8B1
MLAPHQFWQEIHAPGTFSPDPEAGFVDLYPALFHDGRQLALPIRVLPGGADRAVASLIINQASFAVEDALGAAMAEHARAFAPDVIVGVPTLGLPLAANVARRLGHTRMVALGTSRKFWYDDDLSEPLKSITTPGGEKRIYLDPRMLPLLEGRRFALVDDVVSTGASLASVLRLLRKAGLSPEAVVVAMVQGRKWEAQAAGVSVRGAIETPLLKREADGRWRPDAA